MEKIKQEIAQIILNEEESPLGKEQKIQSVLTELTNELMIGALQLADDLLLPQMQAEGYYSENLGPRTLTFSVGTANFKRRYYKHEKKENIYRLDQLLGIEKYQRFSPLMEAKIAEIIPSLEFRRAAQILETLTTISISHTSIRKIGLKIAEQLREGAKLAEELEIHERRDVDYLMIEGDEVYITEQKGDKMGLHRFQCYEGVSMIGKRPTLVNPYYISGFNYEETKRAFIHYIDSHYRLKNLTIISNSDGGIGYTSGVFDELAFGCKRHEHFRDKYHVVLKLKDRLRGCPELIWPFWQAIRSYDENMLKAAMDTAESIAAISENEALIEAVEKLIGYLDRNWPYMKPLALRGIEGNRKGLGSCETNHKPYTVRMKKQGRCWKVAGAYAVTTIIDNIKNQLFTYHLSAYYNYKNICKNVSAFNKNKQLSASKFLKKIPHQTHNGTISASFPAILGSTTPLSATLRAIKQ